MSISVKENPELRHIFAHLQYAIDFLIEGLTESAKGNVVKARMLANGADYEMRSIEGLYMWDDDDQFLEEVSKYGCKEETKLQEEEELQG